MVINNGRQGRSVRGARRIAQMMAISILVSASGCTSINQWQEETIFPWESQGSGAIGAPEGGGKESSIKAEKVAIGGGSSVGTVVDDPLARAANSAAKSLESLAMVEQAKTPPAQVHNENIPEDIRKRIKISWVGPIEKALKGIADAIGYDFLASGDRKAPVIVDLRYDDAPAYRVLQDAGMQAGRHATVAVNVSERTVEVRYEN